MSGIEGVDEQLEAVCSRRQRAIDELIQNMITIDTCSARLDVLLDRKREMA